MFIAVDLKVIEGLAAAVARSSGASEEAVGWGLVRLWHRCWADEIDHLGRGEMAGVFGGQNLDLVTAALESFGFLERSEAGWRVKGAGRYLRLKESRRRGAVETNAKKRRSKATASDAQSRSRASLSDAQSRSLTESPNTESPNTEENTLRAEKPPAGSRRPEQPPDPRHAPMVAALTAIYAEETRGSRYGFRKRDAVAVKALLALSKDDEEIHFKWRTAIRCSFDKFHTPKVFCIADLVEYWNAYTAVKAGAA